MNDLIDASWLSEHINDEDLILLDSSPIGNKSGLAAKFPDLQIKSARYLDLKAKFSMQDCSLPNTVPDVTFFEQSARELGINRDSTLIVYDNLGIYTSPRIWYLFKSMGHKNVAILDGGLDAWVEAGGATEMKSFDTCAKGDFVASFNEQFFTKAQTIREEIGKNTLQVLDARSAGRFHGTAAEPRIGLRGGHIPESMNFPFKDLLHNGKFRSNKELRKIFSEIDSEEIPLVYTCGSGLTACIVLFAANLVLENPMSIYDGSWTEWGQNLDLPIINPTLEL